ncbi:MAG: FkbM family methyltransferase [SAR324 cluster bacterium]
MDPPGTRAERAGSAHSDLSAVARLRLPGLPPFVLHVHGQGDRFISEALRARGVWEPLETRAVLALLEPGDGFVDLGAHLGYYSVLAALRVGPAGRVLACEPDPENFALLERNLAENGVGWVRRQRCAVSDRAGRSWLYRSADNKGDHRLYDSEAGRRAVAASAVTLDGLLEDPAEGWHLVKMDTQGCEALILRGAERVLAARGGRLAWLVEFWPFGLERSGAGADELLARLAKLDVELAILDEGAGRAVPTTVAALSELARGGLRPETGWFVNLAAVPRAQPERWARVLQARIET